MPTIILKIPFSQKKSQAIEGSMSTIISPRVEFLLVSIIKIFNDITLMCRHTHNHSGENSGKNETLMWIWLCFLAVNLCGRLIGCDNKFS